MELQVKQCNEIKTLLQRLTGVEDIGEKTRVREIIDLKYSYYRLCKTFTKSTYSLMALVLGGYDHATAIHGVKTFDALYQSKSFTCNNIYNEARIVLMLRNENIPLPKNDIYFYNLLSEDKYFTSSINIKEKLHSVIKRKAHKIKELEKELEKIKGLHLIY